MAIVTQYFKADNLEEAREGWENWKAEQKQQDDSFNITPAQVVDVSPVLKDDNDFEKKSPKRWRVVYNDYKG